MLNVREELFGLVLLRDYGSFTRLLEQQLRITSANPPEIMNLPHRHAKLSTSRSDIGLLSTTAVVINDEQQFKFLVHYACMQGGPEILGTLLAYGADFSQRTSCGETCWHIAAFHSNPAGLVWLAQNTDRSLINTAEYDTGLTPLHIAMFKGSRDIIELLISYGADTNITDKYGMTPDAYASLLAMHPVQG